MKLLVFGSTGGTGRELLRQALDRVSVFLRHAFADHERQEAVVEQSTLDWTIVRPPHLTDGLPTGTYRHGFSTANKQIRGTISRADVADFMLRQLTDSMYLRQTPGVSN